MSELKFGENSTENEKPLRKLQVAVYELSQASNLVADNIGGDLETMAVNDYNETDAKDEILKILIPEAVKELEETISGVDFKDQADAVIAKVNELI